jgi:biotin-dependent carboxylase-like uncharacterized protein
MDGGRVNSFEVLQGGPLTTIQDMGRPGLGGFGIPEGGALDRRALARANELVGNAAGAAGFEFTLQGPRLAWAGDVEIAVAMIGDREQVMTLGPQGTLDPLFLHARARGYVAVAGGIDAKIEAGGRGACLAGGFGGIVGRGLHEGDIIPVVATTELRLPILPMPAVQASGEAADQRRPVRLRVLLHEGMTLAAIAGLFEDEWIVGDGNRAGIHLVGEAMQLAPILMSTPTCPGAIQVTGAGQPIILLRDHPTVGGYPIVAVIIQADLDTCGQLRRDARVNFQQVTEEEALDALRRL